MDSVNMLAKMDVFGFQVLRILLSILWQSVILFAAAGAIAFILRRRGAGVRYKIWAFVLCILPLVPILVWGAREIGTPQLEVNVLPNYFSIHPQSAAGTPSRISQSEIAGDSGKTVEQGLSFFRFRWALLFILYTGTAGFFMLLVVIGRVRIWHWKMTGTVVVSDRVLGIFSNVRSSIGIERQFIIVESSDSDAPLTIGTIHPVVILPEGFADELTDDELRSVALHELTHIRRFDSLVFTIVSVVRALFFFNPLVWYAARQVSILAENACDDAVVEGHGDPLTYARMLVRLADRFSKPALGIEIAAGFIFSRRVFLRRVEQILADRGDRFRKLSKRVLAITATVMTLAIIAVCALPAREKTSMINRAGYFLTEVDDSINEFEGGVREIVPEGELGGIVLGPENVPLEGVTIDLEPHRDGGEVYTDTEGRFRLTGLPKQYRVLIRFSKEGYSPELVVRQKTAVGNIVVRLTDKTYFSGRVIGPDGVAVPGASLRARQPMKRADGYVTDQIWTETVSGNDGSYRLYVDDDMYDIQVKAPGVGVARLVGEIISKDQAKRIDFHLESEVFLRARVVDSITGEPVQGLRLWHWQHPDAEGISDENGLIEIGGMFPGEFDFRVEGDGVTRWWSENAVHEHQHRMIRNGWQRNFDGLTFDLARDMEPVVIVTEKAVTVTGRVLDPDGNPVNGATVAPAHTGSGNSITGDTRFSYQTDEKGRFTMYLPASGDSEYNLVAHDGKYGEWRNWANGVMEPIKTVPGQVVHDVTISLTRPCIIRGIVLDMNGRPLADQPVRSHSTDKRGNRYYDPLTHTDTYGRFELNFVRPGKHEIYGTRYILDAEIAPEGLVKEVTLGEQEVIEDIQLVGFTREELPNVLKMPKRDR